MKRSDKAARINEKEKLWEAEKAGYVAVWLLLQDPEDTMCPCCTQRALRPSTSWTSGERQGRHQRSCLGATHAWPQPMFRMPSHWGGGRCAQKLAALDYNQPCPL